ncbi:MAG: glycosyltransferase family 4 protein [Aureliella sp.]
MRRRRRILMLAPGCDGNDVGESWSCFQWVKGIAEQHDVTVLTLHRHRQQSLEEQLPNARVVQWADLRLPEVFERFQCMAKPGYLRFYNRAKSWMAKALKSGEQFDLVHQVGPLALRYASPAASFPWPLVIGPLAGSLRTPPGFEKECGRSSALYTRMRGVDSVRLRFDRALRNSYEKASLVLGVAPYVETLLQGIRVRRFELVSETGIRELAPPTTQNTGDQVRLLYVGRLVRTKGLRDLIRAMGSLKDLHYVTLDVAGTGEDESFCRNEVERLGIEDRVFFHGQLTRGEVESLYRLTDVFVFPSFREPSGNVVFEAMRHGLPVITTDRGGPGFLVDEKSGVKLAANGPEQLARDLGETIRKLATTPALRMWYSQGARSRVAEVGLWSSKIKHMLGLYEEVLEQHASEAQEVFHVG